jgi:hypothetical protein
MYPSQSSSSAISACFSTALGRCSSLPLATTLLALGQGAVRHARLAWTGLSVLDALAGLGRRCAGLPNEGHAAQRQELSANCRQPP